LRLVLVLSELLRGEALFVVEHNPGRPFIVSANRTKIRAVGTQFNVRRRLDDTDVTVLEGVVQVTGFPIEASPPGARELALANRTAQVNQIRGLLAEFGIVVPQGVARLRHALPRILEDAENGVPVIARQVLVSLLDQLHTVDEQMAGFDRQIRQIAEASEPAQRLMNIGGIGPQTATALVATMGDPNTYDSGRNFAASLGLTPRQNSSGNKERLGPITRKGDCYLRKLLVLGAQACLRLVHKKNDHKSNWAKRLKERRHTNVAAVALAAKHARIAWAILAHDTEYRPAGPEVVAA
jgi:transposase